MNSENTFSYIYSAQENQEVLNIRKKYLPREESEMEELMRLDNLVQSSGMVEGLSAGIGGTLIFGLGLCLAMEVIGQMMWLGVVVGLVGIAGILSAFPVYRSVFKKSKEKHTPRILELVAALTGEMNQ